MDGKPNYKLLVLFSIFFLLHLSVFIEHLFTPKAILAGEGIYLFAWGYLAVLSYKSNFKLINSTLLVIIGVNIVWLLVIAFSGYSMNDVLRGERYPKFFEEKIIEPLTNLVIIVAAYLYARSQKSELQVSMGADGSKVLGNHLPHNSEMQHRGASSRSGATMVNRSNHKGASADSCWSEEFTILMEYDTEVAKCYAKILKTTDELAGKFRAEVIRDNTQCRKIMLFLLAEYGRSLAPYKSKRLNDALLEAKKYGKDAEQEFRRVVKLTGETVSVERLLSNLREKNPETNRTGSVKSDSVASSASPETVNTDTEPSTLHESPHLTGAGMKTVIVDRFSSEDGRSAEKEGGVSILEALQGLVGLIWMGWIIWIIWHDLIPWFLSL